MDWRPITADELEKLIAFASRELDEQRPHDTDDRGPPSSDRFPDRRREPGGYRGGHRKKRWLEILGDIFD